MVPIIEEEELLDGSTNPTAHVLAGGRKPEHLVGPTRVQGEHANSALRVQTHDLLAERKQTTEPLRHPAKRGERRTGFGREGHETLTQRETKGLHVPL